MTNGSLWSNVVFEKEVHLMCNKGVFSFINQPQNLHTWTAEFLHIEKCTPLVFWRMWQLTRKRQGASKPQFCRAEKSTWSILWQLQLNKQICERICAILFCQSILCFREPRASQALSKLTDKRNLPSAESPFLSLHTLAYSLNLKEWECPSLVRVLSLSLFWEWKSICVTLFEWN